MTCHTGLLIESRLPTRSGYQACLQRFCWALTFLSGKIDRGDLVVMVQGDPRLRRPYVVAVTTDHKDERRHAAACRLAAFLRDPQTQAWIAGHGKNRLDDQPLFFPVTVPAEK